MYGTDKAWSDALRSFKDGRLEEDLELLGAGKGSFPGRNGLGLPMANPPPPRDHYLKMSTRFHSKFFSIKIFFSIVHGHCFFFFFVQPTKKTDSINL
jgi:hypothetical protein